MGRFIILSLVALPLVEIAAFIAVGKAIGILATLGLVVLAVVAGALILRLRGFALPVQMRAALARGEMPASVLADGVVTSIGAVLLIVPGFVTDVVGLMLLLPPVRHLLFRLARRHMRVATVDMGAPRPADWRQPDTIELESDAWRDR